MKSGKTVKLILHIVVILSFLSFINKDAGAENKGVALLIIGAGVMGVGTAMLITAEEHHDTCDDCGSGKGLAGVGVFGAGAAIAIAGVYQHMHNQTETKKLTPAEKSLESKVVWQFGVAPIRKGVGGGLAVRW